MASMTTRAAALALATGVSLSGGAIAASAASADSLPLPLPLPTCTPSSSPLTICAPSMFGFNPTSASVGDHSSIPFVNYRPGTQILLTVPSFPRFERTYSAKVFPNGDVTFSLLIPLNALPQIAYNVNVVGTALDGHTVQYQTKIVVHTAKKPKIVQLLRDKNLYFNIAPSVQKKSDKKIIAAYYKKLHANSVAGSKGSATTGEVLDGSAVSTTVKAAPLSGAPTAVRTVAKVAPAVATSGLAFTGAEIAGMSLIGAGLLGTGAFLVVAGRRRKASA